MDQLKKEKRIAFVLLAVIASLIFGCVVAEIPQRFAYAEIETKIILYPVKVYQTADLTGEAIGELAMGENVSVTQVGQNASYVIHDSASGWVMNDTLGKLPKEKRYTYESRRITVTASVREVHLYAQPNRNGEILAWLPDGAKVTSYAEQGDYVAVIYGEKSGWVLKEFVTKGLSYNQTLAVIILAVTLGAGILIGILIYLRHRIPKQKKEEKGKPEGKRLQ